jgi:hypothetical protein
MKLGNWTLVNDCNPGAWVLYLFGGKQNPDGGYPLWAGLFMDFEGAALVLHTRGHLAPTVALDVDLNSMEEEITRAYTHIGLLSEGVPEKWALKGAWI